MKHLKKIFIASVLAAVAQMSWAQIGYQVSLLNSATGEPRGAETVNVEVTLSNSEGGIICTEKKSETTNDFGILSLVIGNQNSFADVDWTKLPFYVSVSVDGKLVGKTQILTVPVAEYAKKTGVLTKEKLVGTWTYNNRSSSSFTFSLEGTCSFKVVYQDDEESRNYKYYIDGNNIILIDVEGDNNYQDFGPTQVLHYVKELNIIVSELQGFYRR
ncbi:MAG: hypothetical protein IJZ68_04750 [Bacteroidaceae bacterium]|nr:hypothetical protein [Bacteroidaceae bacterium]